MTTTPPPSNKSAGDDVARFTDLERKRLSLCQQRVQLERRLFEASHKSPEPKWPDYVGTNDNDNKNNDRVEDEEEDHPQPVNNNNNNNSLLNSSTTDLAVETTREDKDTITEQEPPTHTDSSNANNPLSIKNVTNHTVHFERGHGQWTGPLNQETNTPHGRGTMVYANGQVYEGTLEQGMRQGFGKNTWPDGQQYQGLWERNSRTGRGSHSTWKGEREDVDHRHDAHNTSVD